jgi:hypothetical protein
MGRRGDIRLLKDKIVDAAEHSAGWRYYLINSRPQDIAAILGDLDSRVVNII